MEQEPIINSTEKVSQFELGLSLKPTNTSEFPTVYADNIWDIATDGTNLAELLENTGSFTQAAINELFAKILIEYGFGGAGLGYDNSFDSSFG